MKFTSSSETPDYPIRRFVSENEIWEVGIHPVLYGVRVAANRVGSLEYAIDYCCADNHGFAGILLATVMRILESLPESTTEYELIRLFPGYKVRPIDWDEECWPKLLEMLADRTKNEFVSDRHD